jgi:hypothetical protein
MVRRKWILFEVCTAAYSHYGYYCYSTVQRGETYIRKLTESIEQYYYYAYNTCMQGPRRRGCDGKDTCTIRSAKKNNNGMPWR